MRTRRAGRVSGGMARNTATLIAVAVLALGTCSQACADFERWDCPILDVGGAGGGGGGQSCDCQAATPPRDLGGPRPDQDGGSVASRSCDPCLAGLVGKTLRFSWIEVTEPSTPPGLPDYLNGIWQEDICRHILNIMLRIDTIDLDTGVIEFTAGPAWHDRDPYEQSENPNGLPMGVGCLDGTNPVLNPPSAYYFLPEYRTQLSAQLREGSCVFDTITENARLRFHAGRPNEKYFTCSPLNSNEIPIEKLFASGRITDDCGAILDANLTGCIAHAAACEICAWGIAPDYTTWAVDPNPDTVPVPCDLSYCKHHCSAMWPNFGAMVSGIFGVPRTCDLDNNPCPAGDDSCREEGYALAGFWRASLVELSE